MEGGRFDIVDRLPLSSHLQLRGVVGWGKPLLVVEGGGQQVVAAQEERWRGRGRTRTSD